MERGEWISVDERLPESKVDVLFVNKFDGEPAVCLGYKQWDAWDSAQWFDKLQTDRDGDYADVYHVTHWMPLPEPPKTDTSASPLQTQSSQP